MTESESKPVRIHFTGPQGDNKREADAAIKRKLSDPEIRKVLASIKPSGYEWVRVTIETEGDAKPIEIWTCRQPEDLAALAEAIHETTQLPAELVEQYDLTSEAFGSETVKDRLEARAPSDGRPTGMKNDTKDTYRELAAGYTEAKRKDQDLTLRKYAFEQQVTLGQLKHALHWWRNEQNDQKKQ